MNEEEKESFKFLKDVCKAGFNSRILGSYDLKNIVNIIEKQQKEIERLKKFEKYYENEKVVWQRKDYVSKNKIKEIFNTKIYNCKYLSETDWTNERKGTDLRVANILKIILDELLGD